MRGSSAPGLCGVPSASLWFAFRLFVGYWLLRRPESNGKLSEIMTKKSSARGPLPVG